MGKKGTPHRKYSKEEKMRYIRLHLEDHISVRQIERDYGIGNALVSSWSSDTYKTERTPWSLTTGILMQLFIVVSRCQRWNVCGCWWQSRK